VTRHLDITTPADRVRCPVEHAELSALGCASRHVAREYRGHRHGHNVAAAARHPACAGCELGAVAASRLGIPGTPGRRPVRVLPVVTEPVYVRVSPRSRAKPGLVDDIPAANLRVVPHPRDVHATGRYPWV
jgi:hypothetical protein